MRCAAIIEPTFKAPDLAFIEGIRQKYDGDRFGWIPPHITLVYPTAYLPPELFLLEISILSQGERQFPLEFSRVITTNCQNSAAWHVYLVPNTGYEACTRLHSRYYSDKLAGQWPEHISFEPHLCVARFQGDSDDARHQAEVLAAQLHRDLPPMTARGENLRIVKVQDPDADDPLGEASVAPGRSHLVEIGRVVLDP